MVIPLVLLCMQVGQDLLRGFDAGAQVGVLAVVVVLRCFAGVLGLKWFQAVDWQPRILRLLSTLNPSCETSPELSMLCRWVHKKRHKFVGMHGGAELLLHLGVRKPGQVKGCMGGLHGYLRGSMAASHR